MEINPHAPSTSSRERILPLRLPSAGRDVNRKLRAHRKSRQGCGNCKLRKVKCDECRPKCNKCTAFGVLCNYEGKHTDLQLSANGAFTIDTLPKFSRSLEQSIPSMIAPSLRQQWKECLANASYPLRDQDLELLSKFQGRTVLTISTGEGRRTYQNEIIKLASVHPFLMHTILALTLMHDHSLSAIHPRLSAAEAFHWGQGLTLFNSKLSGPVQPSERDALWATSLLLGIIAFYCIDETMPEEAWPLTPPSLLDLIWLNMSVGKREIFKITQPLRPDSVFRAMILDNMAFLPNPATGPRLGALPSEFIDLCGFNTTSTSDNNPYYAVASALAHSLNSDCIPLVILNFLYFLKGMPLDYKRLLEEKDPRALLLLAYWYAKVCQYENWWIGRRASLQCQAICIYLERYHRYDTNIQKLLQSLKMMFEMTSA